MPDIDPLLALIPRWITACVAPRDPAGLEEIVVDLGRPPRFRFITGEAATGGREVGTDDLQYILGRVTRFRDDNRAGIERTLHQIACVRDRYHEIVGFTFRVGRTVDGAAEPIADLLAEGRHALLVGPPGVGKTTVLRSAAAILADRIGRRTVIADTSNEIGGDGRVPHPAIGTARRLQVPLFDPSRPATPGDRQAQLVLQAVANHGAESLIIDEIGFESDARVARTMVRRGVQVVATAHGRRINDVVFNPDLACLVGSPRPVLLSPEEAARAGCRHTVLERAEPPAFDRVVEIARRDLFVIHRDVAASVDAVLNGLAPAAEIRRAAPPQERRNTPPDAPAPWSTGP